MTEPVLSRVAEARTFLSKLWKLAAPYWWADGTAEIGIGAFRVGVAERWIARGLLLIILFLNVFLVYLSTSCSTTGTAASSMRCRTRTREAFWAEMRFFGFLWRSSSSSWRSTGSGCASTCRSAGGSG